MKTELKQHAKPQSRDDKFAERMKVRWMAFSGDQILVQLKCRNIVDIYFTVLVV